MAVFDKYDIFPEAQSGKIGFRSRKVLSRPFQ